MSATRNVRRKCVSVRKLLEMVEDGVLVPSPCQRNERWNAKDKTNFVTAILRDTTFATTILISRAPPSSTDVLYYNNDGQNRLAAICLFMQDGVSVRAGDVLLPLPNGMPAGRMLTFSDFTPIQQEEIRNVVFDLVELPQDDPEYLREVANNMNRGKPSSAAERIHSWGDTHSIVGKVLNPLDKLLAAKMHKMRPHWRCKNHGLVVLFARVMAITDWKCDRALWLTSTAMVEAWVFRTPQQGYTRKDYQTVHGIVIKAIHVMDVHGFRFDRPLFVDLCWAIDAFQLDAANLKQLCSYLVGQCALCSAGDPLVDKKFESGGMALLRRTIMANFLRQELQLPLLRNARMLLATAEVNAVGFVPNEDDDTDNDDDDDDEEGEREGTFCEVSGLALFMS